MHNEIIRLQHAEERKCWACDLSGVARATGGRDVVRGGGCGVLGRGWCWLEARAQRLGENERKVARLKADDSGHVKYCRRRLLLPGTPVQQQMRLGRE
jgi:hypothetical protein